MDARAGKTGHGLCRPLEQSYDAGTARMALGKPDGRPDLWLHGALAKLSLLEVGPRLPDGEGLELSLVGLVRMPSRVPFSFSFLTQKQADILYTYSLAVYSYGWKSGAPREGVFHETYLLS